jgi:valyl-tRNA synthetase
VGGHIGRYDFAHAALALYDFVYGELCDWYLELVKPRLREGERDLASTLLHVLTETLALAHPIIPFVTEEIYGYIPGAEGLLAAGITPAPAAIDAGAEAAVGQLMAAVQAVRAWRDFAQVPAGTTLPARVAAEGYEQTQGQLARLSRLELTRDGAAPMATVPVPGGAVELLPSEQLDLGAAERKREARRAEVEQEIARSEAKLANQGFVTKAPPTIVQAERDKLDALRAELEAL